jgi:hypothetical protein
MAFTVEDGTGLAEANSGASLEEADAYFEDRLVTAWTSVTNDDQKQGALIRATDYIELRFASRFKWSIQFPDTPQALSFPRINNEVSPAVVIGMPTAYKRAIFEYALRTLDGTSLAPDATVTASGIALVSESHKVGPIEDSYRYASKGAGSTPQPFRSYPTADAQLASLLKSYSGLIR